MENTIVRHVLMKLRVAVKEDFADIHGEKRIGVLFFAQSSSGRIESQPFYFTEETDMLSFKELYAANQIYVPVNAFDEVVVSEENPETGEIVITSKN